MNIDDLTFGQIKEIASLVSLKPEKHPLDGQKVIAVLPNGFIHFGQLHDIGGRYRLDEACNLRYWTKRDNGLPGFAENGPNEDDKIDTIGTVYIENVLFFYVCGEWS